MSRQAASAAPPGSPAGAACGPSTSARDRLGAALLAGARLALYARTAAPTITGGDAAELAAAAQVLGIPHPPGYPLFTLATAVVARLAFWVEPAAAPNLAASLFAALAVGLAVLFVRRLGASALGAATSGLALAFGPTFWAQATICEVYTFDVLLALGALHLALGFARAPAPRRAVALGVALGLWLGHRPVNLLFVPGVALLVHGWMPPARRPRPRELLGALAGGLASLVVFAYLPLRSAADPPIDVGDPESWGRFSVVVRATPYLRHVAGGATELAWARLGRALAAWPAELGPGLPLGLLGLLLARAGRPARLLGWSWILVADLAFASRYHVLDVEVFFLPATLVLALLAARGTDAVAALARRRPGAPALLAAAIVALAALPLPARYAERDRSTDRATERFARDLLASCAERGILLVNGDTSIHALWYLQGVLGERPDVAVVSLGHVRPWYVEALERAHPDVPWPPVGETTPPSRWGRALAEAVGDARPLYLSLAVDPSAFSEPPKTPGGARFGTLPRGLVSWLLPFGSEADARALADFDFAFFERALPALLPLRPEIDMDTKSIVAQYALALDRAAGLWSARGERERVVAGLRWLLALEPDRHERDVRDDVRRGLGQELPALELGRKARERLAQLGAGG